MCWQSCRRCLGQSGDQRGGRCRCSTALASTCNLGSWFEAWNIFIAIRIQIAPNTALELVKYQSIICQLFLVYSVAASLKYDKLFRQAAARENQQALRWDVLNEDLLIWCVTNPALRTRKQSSYPRIRASGTPAQHPAATTGSLHHGEHATHIHHQVLGHWLHSAKSCPRTSTPGVK